MIKRRRVQIFLIILSVGLLLTACARHRDSQEDGNPAVQVEKARRDALVGTLHVRGKLEPVTSSNVVPSGQGGKVELVHFDQGEPVEKGQVLITLEHDLLSSAVRQAEKAVQQAETGLELAKINYEKAKADYERGKTLYEQGAIPATVDNPMAGKGFEDYETAYKIAGEQLENAGTALESAKEGLIQVQENYEHAFIRSPISGLVTRVNVNPGELASPAAREPVISVADLSKVIVKTNVDEDMVNHIRLGNEVKVTVPAVTSQPFTGKITAIAPVADENTKAFPIEVQVDNTQGHLKPGMFAGVEFTRRYPEGIVIPLEAVVGSGSEKAVWIVDEGVVERRPVEPGADNGKEVIIPAGIEEGEMVVTTNMDSLREGQTVEIEN